MKINVEEAIEKTKEYLSKTVFSKIRYDFSKYSTFYLFTTENLSYLEKLDVAGKDALTVTGSFDQALNLIFLGANRVGNFDTNHLSLYFAKLKMVALSCLSYHEYLNFFLGEKVLDYKLYLKLRNSLETPFLKYWDFLYELFQYDGQKIVDSRLVDKTSDVKKVIQSNPYLKSEDNYNKTKERMKSVTVTFSDKNLLEIGQEENEIYDIMLFSNIEYYLVWDINATMSEAEYVDFIKNQASQALRENGVIQMAYQYNYRYKKVTHLYKTMLHKWLEKNKKEYDKKEYLEAFKKIIFMGGTLKKNIEMTPDVEDCVYLYVKNKSKSR